MAPNGDAAVVAAAQAAAPAPAAPKKQAARRQSSKPRRISMEGLQRAMSDLALELSRDSKKKAAAAAADAAAKQQQQVPELPAIAEQQQQAEELARCECCGMQEECTPQYVRRVRDRYCGRWVCGLCAAAVNDEAERAAGGGGTRTVEDALAAHMAVCRRFNGFGRTHPALFQADAVIDIVRKLSAGSGPRSPTKSSAAAGTRVVIGEGAKTAAVDVMALIAGVRNDQVVTN